MKSLLAGYDAEETKTQSEEEKHWASHAAGPHHWRRGRLQQSCCPGHACPPLQRTPQQADTPGGPLWLSHSRHSRLNNKIILKKTIIYIVSVGREDLNFNFSSLKLGSVDSLKWKEFCTEIGLDWSIKLSNFIPIMWCFYF